MPGDGETWGRGGWKSRPRGGNRHFRHRFAKKPRLRMFRRSRRTILPHRRMIRRHRRKIPPHGGMIRPHRRKLRPCGRMFRRCRRMARPCGGTIRPCGRTARRHGATIPPHLCNRPPECRTPPPLRRPFHPCRHGIRPRACRARCGGGDGGWVGTFLPHLSRPARRVARNPQKNRNVPRNQSLAGFTECERMRGVPDPRVSPVPRCREMARLTAAASPMGFRWRRVRR